MQRPSRSNMINHYSSADNHATAGSTHTSRTSRANKFPADGKKAYSPPPSLPPLSPIHPNTFRTPPCAKLLTCLSIPPNTTLLLFFSHVSSILLIPVTFSLFPLSLGLSACL
ncbi:hypothetical protein V8C40DRAFT_55317 [Trichoderma camerunense]